MRLLRPSFPLRSSAAIIVSRAEYCLVQQKMNGEELNEPAVPQSPNPALNITDPLFTSLTAASASLNSFDCPLITFGAGSRFALVFAVLIRHIDVVWKCRPRGMWMCFGRKWMRGAARKALRLDCARHAEDILRVAMSNYSPSMGRKE